MLFTRTGLTHSRPDQVTEGLTLIAPMAWIGTIKMTRWAANMMPK